MINKKEIVDELKAAECPLLCNTMNEVYSIPHDYFCSVSTKFIKDKLSVGDSSIYTSHELFIPELYFQQLPGNIHKKIGDKKRLKLFSIIKNYQIAAACVVIFIISLFFLPKNRHIIINKKNDVSFEQFKNAPISLNHLTLQQELEDVKEYEIVEFLKENGHDVNAALMASLEEDNLMKNSLDEFSMMENLGNYLYQPQKPLITK